MPATVEMGGTYGGTFDVTPIAANNPYPYMRRILSGGFVGQDYYLGSDPARHVANAVVDYYSQYNEQTMPYFASTLAGFAPVAEGEEKWSAKNPLYFPRKTFGATEEELTSALGWWDKQKVSIIVVIVGLALIGVAAYSIIKDTPVTEIAIGAAKAAA